MGSDEALSYIDVSSPYDDFRKLRPEYLDKFIAEQLQPNEEFHNLASTALENLYHYLQKSMQPQTVKRLIKGGSMGKGTALKSRSDLDCILVMNGVRDARDLKEKIGGILAQLCDFLNKNPLKKRGWGIRIIRDNRFMVQIEMRHFNRNKAVEVDILPTFDAAVYNGNSLRKLYRSMALYDYDTQQFCSAALATLQRDFIKTKPTKLKSLIRLVKHWCKMYLPWEYGQPRVPNSYLLELLTISVWENAGSQHSFPTALLFKDVMEALYNHRQLNVKWNTYYSLSGNLSGGKPCIMDPANPYNNVYEVVGDWKRVKRVARETLKKPLLRDYSRSVLDTDNSRSPNCCILFILLLLICLFLFYSILYWV